MNRKRILIDHGDPFHLNAGDAAMLVVAVRRAALLGYDVSAVTRRADRARQLLLAGTPDVRFVDAAGRDHTLFHAMLVGRAIPGLAEGMAEACMRLTVLHRRLACPPLRALGERVVTTGYSLPAMHGWLAAVAGCDVVVMAGGGYLCDEFGGAAAGALATAQAAEAFGKPVIWLSQGLGPLRHPVMREIATEVLGAADAIGLRAADADSLVPAEHGRVSLTGDDSLAMLGSVEAEGGARRAGVAVRDCASIGGPDVAQAVVLMEDLADVHDHEVSVIESKTALDARVPDVAQVMRQCVGCSVMLATTYHPALWCAAGGGHVVAVAETEYYRRKFSGLMEMFPGAIALVDSLEKAEPPVVQAMQQQRRRESALQRREELVAASDRILGEWLARWPALRG